MRAVHQNPCLLTDLYQYTMAQAYFDRGRHELEAVFHLFFRKNPFEGNWAMAAGISDAIEFVERFQFDDSSIEYLRSLTLNHQPIFTSDFLSYLRHTTAKVDIYGVRDGEMVFPFEPILRVEGPLFLCQILETALLNMVNFQTLIATKAARLCLAANEKLIMDFGMRRAQGFDGAISASKAAHIGGVHATSNLLAAKHYSLPVCGTLAHSFIMSYPNQQEAFTDFANSFKQNCILVVDTYDPRAGVLEAIKTMNSLKEQGYSPVGLRLDSGDLLYLSQFARAQLNNNGLSQCKIIVSGDLDENRIIDLEENDAPIDIYGVGTRLVTAYEEPALSGVYKLASIKDKGKWRDAYKGSAHEEKSSRPGQQTVMRFFQDDLCVFDEIYDPKTDRASCLKIEYSQYEWELLHQQLMLQGKSVMIDKKLASIREYAASRLRTLPQSLISLKKSALPYPVYFDEVPAKRAITNA